MMRLRACITLLLHVSACATSAPSPAEPVNWDPRYANLQRAAALPWTDGGRCVVQESSQPWPVLAERCYQALDHDRVEFHDLTGRCSVASAGAAAVGFGVCVLAAPEIAAGAVVVMGVVVVGFAIKEALETYELERDRRRRCEPIPVPHAGKDDAHNQCADQFPPNRYPEMDVLVDDVSFDALQVGVPVLWEIKTHQFDTYPDYIREREIENELKQLDKERKAAASCGYGFVIGVSTEAHKAALLREDRTFQIVVTGCKR